ncbi:MAG: two-component system nitrogen regulation sensor histidine kinase GlnL [Hyphomicrobiaceae bacterium]
MAVVVAPFGRAELHASIRWRPLPHPTVPETRPGSFPRSPINFEAVLGALSEGVIVIDLAGCVLWSNASAETLLKRSRHHLQGTTCDNAFADCPWLLELVDRVDAHHAPLRAEGTLTQSGEEIAVIAHATTLSDSAGLHAGAVLTLHAADLALRLPGQDRERARLSELHRLVGQLGHEINNPLSGIRGAAQLLGRRLGQEHESAEYAGMIVRQVDRMAELVTSLMSLEAPPTTLTPCNIHRVISDVLLLLRAEAQSAGIVLIAEFDPSLPDVVGDPDRLAQLFLNLVKNGMTASLANDNPRVVVRTLMEHAFHVSRGDRRVHYIRVEVRDNGDGLDADTQEHMFEPLYSRSTGGHGMGLAVARSIVSGHRGSIAADNIESGGACLRVQLEVAEEPPS